jgi:capsular exopolysaccharide synthesis family protein
VEPVQYLRALRQWWLVIVALAVVGFGAAYVLTSTPVTEYTATHTLVLDGTNSDPVTLSRAAFLAGTGEVAARSAAKLGPPSPDITAGADADLNGVQITATSASPDRARDVADTYAQELSDYLQTQAESAYQTKLSAAQTALGTAQRNLAAAGSDPPDAVQNAYDNALSDLQDLQSSGPPTSGFSTLGTTQIATTGGGASRVMRGLIGGLVGLFLGIVLALVLARFDTRIRLREAAEAAFGAPVVAEIPVLPRKMRKRHTIVTSADPESLSAEAYRSVRTALLITTGANRRRESQRRPRRRVTQHEPVITDRNGSRVVMVVSPGVGEGKTTTSANLAVAFAETGKSVLLLGCDLRRPELHNYFGLTARPGMTELLSMSGRERSLGAYVRDTKYAGIRIVTSGEPVDHPGELLTRGIDLIASARQLADVVIIDTAPVLATDDASVLMPIVDDVVLVCRAGRTPNEAGRRARELLTRLDAPLVGVVLIGAQALPGARSYYRSDYRSRPTVAPPAESELPRDRELRTVTVPDDDHDDLDDDVEHSSGAHVFSENGDRAHADDVYPAASPVDPPSGS